MAAGGGDGAAEYFAVIAHSQSETNRALTAFAFCVAGIIFDAYPAADVALWGHRRRRQ
jgi:hypothetical protein